MRSNIQWKPLEYPSRKANTLRSMFNACMIYIDLPQLRQIVGYSLLKPVGKVWWMKRPLALLRQNHTIRGNVRLHLGIRISSFLMRYLTVYWVLRYRAKSWISLKHQDQLCFETCCHAFLQFHWENLNVPLAAIASTCRVMCSPENNLTIIAWKRKSIFQKLILLWISCHFLGVQPLKKNMEPKNWSPPNNPFSGVCNDILRGPDSVGWLPTQPSTFTKCVASDKGSGGEVL